MSQMLHFSVIIISALLKTKLISKMELFTKIVNRFQSFIIFAEGFILDFWLGS